MRAFGPGGLALPLVFGVFLAIDSAQAAVAITTVTPGSVNVCGGVAVDVSLNVYFQDCTGSSTSGTIKKISSGAAVSEFSSQSFTSGLAMSSDISGNVYAVNTGITSLSATGATTKLAGEFNSFTSSIWASYVASDGSGAVYAVVGSKVVKYVGSSATDMVTGLNGGGAVGLDAAGNIYVSESGSGTVKKFGPGGGSASAPLASYAGLNSAYGLVVDGAGNVYVSEFDSSSIKKIDASGNVTTVVSSGLSNPTDIAIGPDGALYVYDYQSHSIKKITGLGIAGASTSEDCLFDWAEKNYPSLFAQAGSTSSMLSPYHFRFYGSTGAYIGVSSVDKHVYYLGPLSSYQILDAGAVSTWYATAGCQ